MMPENTPEIIERARALVLEKPSPSYLQRKLMIGYSQALELVEFFEGTGLISKPNAAGKRSVPGISG
jgi:DNA segregation ATPase FtsK/SpoIIIE-like protein